MLIVSKRRRAFHGDLGLEDEELVAEGVVVDAQQRVVVVVVVIDIGAGLGVVGRTRTARGAGRARRGGSEYRRDGVRSGCLADGGSRRNSKCDGGCARGTRSCVYPHPRRGSSPGVGQLPQAGFQRRCSCSQTGVGSMRIFHGGVFGHQAGQEIMWPLSFCNIGHHWPLARIINFRLR